MAGKKGCGRKPILPAADSRPCEWCGVVFTPIRKRAKQRFCSRLCQRRWRCRPEVNAIAAEVSRLKRAKAARGKGKGLGYVKFFNRHLHRVMAEKLLGRPLFAGEIVHHKDGDKRNNSWSNLEILPSQSEHARLHGFGKRKEPSV